MILHSNNSFNGFCDYLASRRSSILQAWRKASNQDLGQTTSHSLTRRQFNDHVPEVLDAFERKMRSLPGGLEDRAADVQKKQEEVKHGLHRWQQGYRLQELIHEWGHLHLCLIEELNTFSAMHPELDSSYLMDVSRQMVQLIHEAMSESATQYERMQQAEASGHMGDLKKALESINEIERRRAAQIHQAVHDLHNDVLGVSLAANALGRTSTNETHREEFASILGQGVKDIQTMLGELMELARLEAGQECREMITFDASILITDMGKINRAIAEERGLFLKVEGPQGLTVEGDPLLVRRLLQNLLLNALKYTEQGGVTVSWGEEEANWWLMVKDTGPGMLNGPGAPMAVGLKEATASARESDEKGAKIDGEVSHVLTPPAGSQSEISPYQMSNEGIGLSIVKRLCELLDASLEIASSDETGTTFRVVFPLSY